MFDSNVERGAGKQALQDRSVWRTQDLWVIILLIVPLFGCFYPLESYLSFGRGDVTGGYANLPFPATTMTLIVVTLSVAAFYLVALRRPPFRHNILAYAVIGIAFLSTTWSVDPLLTVQRAMRLLPAIGLGVVLPQLYSPPKLLRMMAIALLVTASLSVLMVFAVPSLGFSRLDGGYESSWRGVFIHKNLAGMVSALAVIIVLGGWWFRAIGPTLAVPTVLLNLLVLVQSQSGTAVGGLLAAIAVAVPMMVIQKCSFPVRLLLMAMMTLLVATIAVAAQPIASLMLGAAGRDMTLTGRTDIWAAVWQQIQAHPIRGYGYAFWSVESPTRLTIWRLVGDAAANSHNSWLDLWLQLGIVGLLATASLMLVAISRCFRLIVLTNDREAPFLLAILVFLLVRSMTEVQFTDPFLYGVFYLVWAGGRVREISGRAATFRGRAARQAVNSHN